MFDPTHPARPSHDGAVKYCGHAGTHGDGTAKPMRVAADDVERFCAYRSLACAAGTRSVPICGASPLSVASRRRQLLPLAASVSGPPAPGYGPGLSNGNELEAAGVLLVEDFHLAVFHIARKVNGEVPSANRDGERRRDRPVGPYGSQECFAPTGPERKLVAQVREIEEQVGDVGPLAGRRCPRFEGRLRPPIAGTRQGRRSDESEDDDNDRECPHARSLSGLTYGVKERRRHRLRRASVWSGVRRDHMPRDMRG